MNKRADDDTTTADGAPVMDGAPLAGDVLDASGRVLLSRTAILTADDVEYEYVEVPEWGGTVRVRSLTGADRDAYDAESWALGQASPNDKAAPLANFRSRRIARAIVDEAGIPMFSARDVVALGAKNAKALDRIDDVVSRLSGMDTEAVKAALEALKAGPSGGSGTD